MGVWGLRGVGLSAGFGAAVVGGVLPALPTVADFLPGYEASA